MESIRNFLKNFPKSHEIDLLCVWPIQQIIIAFQKIEDNSKEDAYYLFWDIILKTNFDKKQMKKKLSDVHLEKSLQNMLSLFYDNISLFKDYSAHVISSLYLNLSLYLYHSNRSEENMAILKDANSLYWEIVDIHPHNDMLIKKE